MAKKAKAPPAPKGARALIATALPTMLGMGGLPAQVRLAAREQQSRPFIPPKKRRGR